MTGNQAGEIEKKKVKKPKAETLGKFLKNCRNKEQCEYFHPPAELKNNSNNKDNNKDNKAKNWQEEMHQDVHFLKTQMTQMMEEMKNIRNAQERK